MTDHFATRFRTAPNSPEFRGARPRAYSRTVENGMIIERDVEAPTRFGYTIYVDVFRPVDETLKSPPLIGWTPYGKHDPAPLAKIYPTCGVKAEWMSDYTIFEAPDPAYWVAKGYVVITADIPGAWYANTDMRLLAPEEAEAFYDLIEWAGVQPWSNGKVGLSGVSYLTQMQWRVAELNPPHLAAINPWEGFSDTYREVARHGGIPETHFWNYIHVRWGASDHRVEDLWRETVEHPFFDAFWESKASQLSKITTPAYVVASWSDHGLHTRGTLEGYKKMASQQKWLEVHGRKKWHWYYEPAARERQRVFFDHFLKGLDSGLDAWPKVNLEVRDRANQGVFKSTDHWPVADTDYARLYLDGPSGRLTAAAPAAAGQVSYDPLQHGESVAFDHRFDQAEQLVGHMKLRLNVSTDDGDDMDLFIAVEKLDTAGQLVGFVHYAVFETGPVALGWLRVSHRELDEAASSEFQPVLQHRRELKIAPGEVVAVDIEILPSGTAFAAGETLRVRIGGRDLYDFPKPMLYIHHEETVNRGRHTLHTGGDDPAYLLIPRTRL